MSTVTIGFASGPADTFVQTFAESGFTFVLGGIPRSDAFWITPNNQGTGGYLLNNYNTAPVIVARDAGLTFGAVSFDLNGLNSTVAAGGARLIEPAVVSFTITGVKVGGAQVTATFTTDGLDGWQQVALPSSFSAGLTELRWVSNQGSGWGAFDNVVLIPNRAPVANAATGATTEEALFTGQLTASDADGQAVTFSPVGSLPTGVTLDANGVFRVQPQPIDQGLGAGQSRVVSFQYRATDGSEFSAPQTATVTITGVNDAPQAQGDSGFELLATAGPLTLDVLANDTDADSNDVRTLVSVNTAGLQGSVAIQGGQLVYTPGSAFLGLGGAERSDQSFTYTMRDSSGVTSTAQVSLTVIGLNDDPVARADAATVTQAQSVTISVMANDFDPDAGDSLELMGVGQGGGISGVSALGAAVRMSGNQVVYTAEGPAFDGVGAGQSVIDTFTYTIQDGWGVQVTQTVTVTVRGAANAPDILGTNKPNFLQGTSGNETIYGFQNNDTINGGAGADRLFGGNDKDILNGDAGADQLFGENGADTLDGGTGADTLTGGNGPDLFVFGESFGRDVITDFSVQHDLIQVSGLVFGGFEDILGSAAQVGRDVVITASDGLNTLTLRNVTLTSLNEDHFLLG